MTLGAIFATVTAGYVTSASGQATRTWVSGVGSDANPCSRTAPCQTFAGAISKTGAGGEINCLDPGGYGAVTITKSITIDCEDTQGSSLASATTGVTVNDGSSGFPGTIRVILRGLSINGAQSAAQNANGNPGTGINGVRFLRGARLHIEKCIIQNFSAGTPNGFGIMVNNTAGAQVLSVTDTTLIQNGSPSATGGGIGFFPTGTGSVNATLTRVSIANNNGAGMHVTGNSIVMVRDSSINNNVNFGILTAAPGSPTIRVGNSSISGNGTGIGAGGGSILSYGNNQLNGNNTDGAFTGPVPPS